LLRHSGPLKGDAELLSPTELEVPDFKLVFPARQRDFSCYFHYAVSTVVVDELAVVEIQPASII